MKRTGYNSNKNLILFFVVTLLWTWVAGFIPVVFGLTGTAIGTVIFYFGGGAPSVVALFLVFRTYPKEARRDFFRRCFSPKRIKWKWIIFTVVLFTLVAVVSLLISTSLFGMDMPGMLWVHIAISKPYMIPLLLFFSLISGPLNEEFGWRGYALDKLLVGFGYVRSSLLLGFIWAVWHLAWYYTPGQAQYDLLQKSPFDAFMFIPFTIALSFVVTFVYVNSQRSILAGAFVHMMANFLTSQLLSPYTAEMSAVIQHTSILFCCLVILYSLLSEKFKKTVSREIENIKVDYKKYSEFESAK